MRAFIVLAVSILGCANSSESHVFEAGDFTDDEIATMQSAADEWCERTAGSDCAMVVNRSPGLESSTVQLTETIVSKHYFAGVVTETNGLDHAVGDCLATVDHLGIRSSAECDTNTDADSFTIQIRDSRAGDVGRDWFHGVPTTWSMRLRTTFLHELGHTFGHFHLARDGTVMNALTSGQTEHLTTYDLAR